MAKEPATAQAPDEPQRWIVVHTGSLYYPSTRTGEYREAKPGQVLDDLPPESSINGKPRPNWVITDGLVRPYTGDAKTGAVLKELPPAEER